MPSVSGGGAAAAAAAAAATSLSEPNRPCLELPLAPGSMANDVTTSRMTHSPPAPGRRTRRQPMYRCGILMVFLCGRGGLGQEREEEKLLCECGEAHSEDHCLFIGRKGKYRYMLMCINGRNGEKTILSCPYESFFGHLAT